MNNVFELYQNNLHRYCLLKFVKISSKFELRMAIKKLSYNKYNHT